MSLLSSKKQWVPLESNPQVLTGFAHALGLSPLLSFSDVFSLDLLDMVPKPRFAVLLLFPLTPKIREYQGDLKPKLPSPSADQPYFCRQSIGNACGTIALIHAALNLDLQVVPLTEGGFLQRFLEETEGKDAEQRANALNCDEGLDKVHGKFAAQGQTAAPPPNERVDLHFVCFVEKGGRLYELDGRREGPLDRGPCEQHKLLEVASSVIDQHYMKVDPNEHRFTILAMTMGEE